MSLIHSKKLGAVIIACGLTGAICLFAIGAVFCAATLHVRRKAGTAPPNAINVEIAAPDRIKLRGWWLQPALKNGNCVIVLHGIADSRVSSVGFAPMFLANGYSVLAPDSRAHGKSGGDFVTYGLLEKYDVIAWAHWMRGEGCHKVYGLGESLGGSILIEATAVEPIFSAIVAECPYADLREIAEYRMRRYLKMPDFIGAPLTKLAVVSGMSYANLVDGLSMWHVSPLESIARASTPILLIHGLQDDQTPPSHSRKLAAANPRVALWLVPNARHTGASAAAPDEFRSRVLSWFATH